MTELNGCEPIQIKVTGPYTMTICDTTGFSAYKTGGYVKQVKMKQTVAFVSTCCSLPRRLCARMCVCVYECIDDEHA